MQFLYDVNVHRLTLNLHLPSFFVFCNLKKTLYFSIISASLFSPALFTDQFLINDLLKQFFLSCTGNGKFCFVDKKTSA